MPYFDPAYFDTAYFVELAPPLVSPRPPATPPTRVETLMTAVVTPPGRGPETLELLEEPRWGSAEQGGYKDATLRARMSMPLRQHVRYAPITIFGPEGVAYFGEVLTVDGDTLTCVGKQNRLADFLRGCVYVASNTGWQEFNYRGAKPPLNGNLDDSGQMEVVITAGETYSKGQINWVYDFPQAIPAGHLYMPVSGLGLDAVNYRVRVLNATGFSRVTWNLLWTLTNATSGTCDISIPAGSTGLRLVFEILENQDNSAGTTITMAPTVHGTSVTSATVANIADHILSQVTSVLPLHEVDASLTTAVDDLQFEPDSSELAKFEELLKYGDWRFTIEPRLTPSGWVPCGVVGPRPSTPIYSLTEGSGDGWRVECDLTGESAEPLCSAVRVRYKDAVGRERYADVTDTDQSHVLVAAGISRTRSISVETTSSTLASAAGSRYLIDAGRDQVQGTVTVTGKPNGIPAYRYKPGELVRLTTNDRGVVTARITESQCDGPFLAVLSLDNSPNIEDVLFRINLARTRAAIRRA